MKFTLNNLEISLVQGDITNLDVDAITNAANNALVLGAGVAGAIYRKGGPDIQAECNAIGHCDVGKAVITTGGRLTARHVIHAVGPRMGEGNEDNKLASAVRETLLVAEENRLSSVAMPAISTGIFGFPMRRCAEIMSHEIQEFSFEMRAYLNHVIVCLYDSIAFQIFSDAFTEQLGTKDDKNQDSTLLLDE